MKKYFKEVFEQLNYLYKEVKENYKYNIDWYKKTNMNDMDNLTKKEQEQLKVLLEKYGNIVIKKKMVTMFNFDNFSVTIKRTK